MGRFAAALEDDFNTPEALAVMHGWRDHELLRRALEVFGLESLAEGRTAPAELEELARARRGGPRAEGLREERPAAGRDRGGGLGRARRRRRARLPARAQAVTSSSSTGAARCARRCAGRGGARALGDRAGAEGRAVAAGGRCPPARKPERELTAEAGTQDHQGVVARVEPYRYADAHQLAAGRRAAAGGARLGHRPAEPGGGDPQRRRCRCRRGRAARRTTRPG